MRNIFSIFRNDIKKIHNNVIAMVVIMGILVMPTLYAWFNIAASWDPYSNTQGIKIAVASSDKGYTGKLLSIQLNMGDEVLSTLHENEQMDWVFTSAKKAADGVKSGKYYAAIVLPEDFTQDMMSIFSSDVKHPKIIYYTNEKENAIAPKVTSKGATTVQQQINSTFTKTISEVALEALEYVNTSKTQAGDDSLAANLQTNLTKISSDLSAASDTMQAFSHMAGAGTEMLKTTSALLEDSRTGAKDTLSRLKESTDGADSLDTAISGTTQTISDAMAQNEAFYQAVSDEIDNALSSYSDDAAAAADSLSEISERVQKIIDGYTTVRDSLTSISDAYPVTEPVIRPAVDLIQEAIDRQTAVKDKLDNAASEVTGAVSDAAALKSDMDTLISQSKDSVTAVKEEYETSVKDKLNNLTENLNTADDSVAGLMNQLDNSVKNVSGITDTASSDLTQAEETLNNSAALLKEASDKLNTAVSALSSPDSEGQQTLKTILSQSPETISSFLGSPVKLKEIKLYAIANYGSAVAPFYSTLAIWVGGVIMAAMLKTAVSQTAMDKLKNPRERHLYLGRMVLFVLIGLFQSGLICLGDLYFLGIQCKHPFLFLLAGWFTSIVYVNIIYALSVSFGDIGKAICVVLMVMQVAGSGGTFPIQVAPEFFQKFYPLLPFTHSMNAMRECIAGFYGNNYWKEMGMLALFLIPSLLLGLILRKPVIRLNNAFMEKLESTHVI
ncbi:MAG TPA: YhgE/Pip domain-containing protein [Candidatus Blautia stercoravium]|nr:YhgE/Pip domain-containing protein [Candidatus Blautia stercoravium]